MHVDVVLQLTDDERPCGELTVRIHASELTSIGSRSYSRAKGKSPAQGAEKLTQFQETLTTLILRAWENAAELSDIHLVGTDNLPDDIFPILFWPRVSAGLEWVGDNRRRWWTG